MEKRPIGNTGLSVEVIGFGGAALGECPADQPATQAADLVQAARDAGISYFDTAPWYGIGRSERVLGDLLRGSDYVLSTKVGRLLKPGEPHHPQGDSRDLMPFHVVYDYSYDGIMRSFEDSLQRLGLDRIDVLFVHDIGEMTLGDTNAKHFADLAKSGYRALEELRRGGQVKAIGLGVNENQACLDALGIGQWDVFLLAGRYTLLEQTPLDALFPACMAAGTSIICGGPFNSGVLVGRDSWNYAKAPGAVLAKVRKLSDVADDYGLDLAAAALQFPLAHSLVSSVLPGPSCKAELEQNVTWLTAPIPAEFWAELKARALLDERAPVPNG